MENPGLDVVAMRKNQAVEAGVAVTGTINSPYVRITSQPPVPESEALAWLVLGHGPGDASRGDLAMLPLAAASLFGDAKTPQGSFAQRLGVDSIALRGGTLNSQVVAVGKRLAHNVYVIYEQAVGATTNVLKLELNMTQRLLMRAEAGQVSSLGLFFRYAFD
jgi:translocation and assembly module TamB